MDGSQPDQQNPCPWLALLLCSASDFLNGGWEIPEVTTRKVGELLTPGEREVRGPALTAADLKAYESVDDLCQTIDLPVPLFSRLVPAKADLPYLAHVRQVHTGDKETLSLQTEGCFSVVLGNRFPETTGVDGGGKNSVYVVSLEGFQRYLPGAPDTIQAQRVRLAVLAHWSFFCEGETTFKTLMQQLDAGRLMLPVAPHIARQAQAGEPGALQVEDAFEQGYTALDHHIRNGEHTVSWYRGPLVPLWYLKLNTYAYLPSADAALRYNYETGLFDASYAAAWQLGRLLALQNPHFARALYRYRTQERQKAKAAMRQESLQKKFALSGKAAEDHVVEAIRQNGHNP
jgi:hypothetical protein